MRRRVAAEYVLDAASVANSNNSIGVRRQLADTPTGNNTFIGQARSFAYGANAIGTNPAFRSHDDPRSPVL